MAKNKQKKQGQFYFGGSENINHKQHKLWGLHFLLSCAGRRNKILLFFAYGIP